VEFGSVKKMKESRGEKWIEDSYAKVNNDDITVRVLRVVEDVFGSVIWVKRHTERKSSILEVLVDNAMAVKIVNSIKNRVDDDDNIMLGKLALCKDVVLYCQQIFYGNVVWNTNYIPRFHYWNLL